MSVSVSIHQMTTEDVGRLSLFAMGHVTEEHYFIDSWEEQQEERRVVLVAELDGSIAGYVHYNRRPQYQPFRSLRIPEIQDLYVDHKFRRMGIGRALIAACEELARADGMQEIGIGVGVGSNFGNAQKLYVGLGFVPDGAGAVFERAPISVGEVRPVDDRLCLMMFKSL